MAASSDAEAPLVRRHSLRQATVILPRTGERSRQKVTLRRAATGSTPVNASEQTPLLSSPGNNAKSQVDDASLSIFGRMRKRLSKSTTDAKSFLVSRTGKNVLKCSIAYFLASMAVFIPQISRLLGSGDGKHLVTNIVVWYHPGRSLGSMTQGSMFASVAFVFSATVCYASMGLATAFHGMELISLGHVLILLVFCGGSLGFMSWMKQRLGDALVNVSISLAAIPIVTISTKEPAIHQGYISHAVVSQALRMAILGILISTVVNVSIWPIRARQDLRENLIKATNGLWSVLASTTSSFLSGNAGDMESSEAMNAAINSLAKNLAEARNEYYIVGLERQYSIEKRLVQCIQRLAQDVGGLKSAASTQFTLLSESVASDKDHAQDEGNPQVHAYTKDCIESSGEHETAQSSSQLRDALSATSPKPISLTRTLSHPQVGSISSSIVTMIRRRTGTSDSEANGSQGTLVDESPFDSAESAEDIFESFIKQLGPPMKSLAYTLQQILVELPFGPGPQYQVTNNPNFRTSLRDALTLFTISRRKALSAVYKSKRLTLERSYWIAADFEEVAASCGHFTSSLEDLAENVLIYLDVLDELEEEITERSRGRSWSWIYFWRSRKGEGSGTEEEEHLVAADPSARRHPMRKTDSLPKTLSGIPSDNMKHPPTDRENGEASLRYRCWLWLSFLRRDDIRFAVKVGAGAALLAMLAYIPRTQGLFFHWRLEWAVVSYTFVTSMTIGAANTTTIKRLVGTSIGAALAIAVWILSDDSAYILAILGWLVSFCCFYIMLALNEGPMARFILLTYNLSVLYSYSLSVNDKDGDEDEGGLTPYIGEIVLHRLAAISIGSLYGLFITRIIWPISARKKLKGGLSLLWLRMALIWKRKPLSLLTDHEIPPSYMDIREEFKLRDFATLLVAMRTNAESELTLRRPFQTDTFHNILNSTDRMLDAIHALNVAITRDLKTSSGELAILQYTRREREELAGRISHLLSVLAASIKIEYPLTDALPDIEHTRDRLLARVHAFRQDKDLQQLAEDDDYEILYVYAFVTAQIAREVGMVAREMEKLYGVLNERVLRLQ